MKCYHIWQKILCGVLSLLVEVISIATSSFSEISVYKLCYFWKNMVKLQFAYFNKRNMSHMYVTNTEKNKVYVPQTPMQVISIAISSFSEISVYKYRCYWKNVVKLQFAYFNKRNMSHTYVTNTEKIKCMYPKHQRNIVREFMLCERK